MHIGATIITHQKNWEFYNHDVLNYAPRTLEPDMIALWPHELAEGSVRNGSRKLRLSDGIREMHISYVQPLAHVEGMLMAYFQRKIASRPICSIPVQGATARGHRAIALLQDTPSTCLRRAPAAERRKCAFRECRHSAVVFANRFVLIPSASSVGATARSCRFQCAWRIVRTVVVVKLPFFWCVMMVARCACRCGGRLYVEMLVRVHTEPNRLLGIS